MTIRPLENNYRVVELPTMGGQVLLAKNTDGDEATKYGIGITYPVQAEELYIYAELKVYYATEEKRDAMFNTMSFEELEKTANSLVDEIHNTIGNGQ